MAKIYSNDLKIKIYLQNDKMFNQTILDLDAIKDYVQFLSEPKDEQEKHIYYMIEKEAQALKESIEILKNKRTEQHYKEL